MPPAGQGTERATLARVFFDAPEPGFDRLRRAEQVEILNALHGHLIQVEEHHGRAKLTVRLLGFEEEMVMFAPPLWPKGPNWKSVDEWLRSRKDGEIEVLCNELRWVGELRCDGLGTLTKDEKGAFSFPTNSGPLTLPLAQAPKEDVLNTRAHFRLRFRFGNAGATEKGPEVGGRVH